jgi:glycosyltransferase involved in cell wall biosynthesis
MNPNKPHELRAPDYPTATPSVAVAIPVRNEEANIDSVLKGFSESEYPAIVDILVVDGKSTDRTCEIVSEWTRRDPRIRLLQNPWRFQSYALNIALNSTQADVFLRADAHCVYAQDYVQICVAELIRTRALNVGGAQRFVCRTLVQAGIALAVQSPFGSGGAKYRNWNYDGFAETVFLGCFRRETLLMIGGYAEYDGFVNEDAELNRRLRDRPFSLANETNQDAELNLTLGSRKESIVYVSRRIKVWYWPRKKMRSLGRQYFNYGRGRAITACRHRYLHTRATVILGLWTLCVIFVFAGIFTLRSSVGDSVALCGIGLAIVLLESVRVTLVRRQMFAREIWRGAPEGMPSGPKLIGVTAAAISIMVASYPLGFLYQAVRICWRRRIAW